MYSLMIDRGAPPQDAAKQDGGQKWFPHRCLRMWSGNSCRSLRAETPLGGSDEPREGNLRRVVHE